MTDTSVAAMHQALLGRNPTHARPTTPAFDGPQEITIVAGGTPDGVYFTVDNYSGDWRFGPAPFPRPQPGMVPPAGTKGLAHFSRDGTRCWVTALWAWP